MKWLVTMSNILGFVHIGRTLFQGLANQSADLKIIFTLPRQKVRIRRAFSVKSYFKSFLSKPSQRLALGTNQGTKSP